MTTLAEATIAIGVFTNNRDTFDPGRGGLAAEGAHRRSTPRPTDRCPSRHPAPPTTPQPSSSPTGTSPPPIVGGLYQETLRDISHTAMGLGAMSNGAATAGIQGVDLFGEQQARIVAGYERSAGYVNAYLDKVASLGGAAPPSSWVPPGWPGTSFKVGGLLYTGGWEVAYSHYADRGGHRDAQHRTTREAAPTDRRGDATPVLADPHQRSLRLTRGGRRPPGRGPRAVGSRKRTSLTSSSSRVAMITMMSSPTDQFSM